jgi:hypothetical protein
VAPLVKTKKRRKEGVKLSESVMLSFLMGKKYLCRGFVI